MSFESGLTGNQVVDAINRVRNNEFANVVTSTLNVSAESPMILPASEPKYLSREMNLNENTRYIIEISGYVTPLVLTGQIIPVQITGQGVAGVSPGFGSSVRAPRDGLGEQYSQVAGGSERIFTVPGEINLQDFVVIRDAEEALLDRRLDEEEVPANMPRAFYYRNEIITDTSPTIRFHYAASPINSIEVSQFNVICTEISPDNFQERDIAVEL